MILAAGEEQITVVIELDDGDGSLVTLEKNWPLVLVIGEGKKNGKRRVRLVRMWLCCREKRQQPAQHALGVRRFRGSINGDQLAGTELCRQRALSPYWSTYYQSRSGLTTNYSVQVRRETMAKLAFNAAAMGYELLPGVRIPTWKSGSVSA